MIDLHCHILPGLDDGARDMAQAVEMGRIAQDDGIRVIVGTPHLFRGDFKEADSAAIGEARSRLKAALEAEGIGIEILTGAEVHITHGLSEAVRRDRKRLVLAESSYMFVEFPHDHVFSGVKDLLFNIMSERIIPIIAHPERNASFVQSPHLLFELVSLGALVQINAGSFLGHFGTDAHEAAYRFLESRLVHFIGSDGHNTRSKAPRLAEAVRLAADVLGKADAEALVKSNPEAVIRDKEIPYHPDPVDPEPKRKTLKLKFSDLFKNRK